MPKKQIWTELLFSCLPVEKDNLKKQILIRLIFLFALWFIGLAAYTFDGLSLRYVTNFQVYMTLFGTGLIVLFGTYMIQRELRRIVSSFRPLLKLDDVSFKKFSERIERYSFSFIPCLLMAIPFTLLFSGGLNVLYTAFFSSFHEIWNLAISFFLNLLTSTGLWMGISIWLAIFLISNQPLRVQPSQNTIDIFRGLAVLALWFSLFYFLAITIGVVIPVLRQPAMSFLDIMASPLLFFIAIGVIGILLPFYNIHRALLKVKRKELQEIEEEFKQLHQDLDRTLAELQSKSTDKITITMGRLMNLQIKERETKMTQEWPIDISFLTKLLGLILVPAVVRVLIELINRFYL